MMRGIIPIMIAAFITIFPLSASRIIPNERLRNSDETVLTVSHEENVETYESLHVDMKLHNDGYYAFMSDVEVHYGADHAIEYLSINNPSLLSFNVSSQFNGGVWILDLNEGEKILNELKDVNDVLKETGNHELSQKIESIILLLENSGPFTQAST